MKAKRVERVGKDKVGDLGAEALAEQGRIKDADRITSAAIFRLDGVQPSAADAAALVLDDPGMRVGCHPLVPAVEFFAGQQIDARVEPARLTTKHSHDFPISAEGR